MLSTKTTFKERIAFFKNRWPEIGELADHPLTEQICMATTLKNQFIQECLSLFSKSLFFIYLFLAISGLFDFIGTVILFVIYLAVEVGSKQLILHKKRSLVSIFYKKNSAKIIDIQMLPISFRQLLAIEAAISILKPQIPLFNYFKIGIYILFGIFSVDFFMLVIQDKVQVQLYQHLAIIGSVLVLILYFIFKKDEYAIKASMSLLWGQIVSIRRIQKDKKNKNVTVFTSKYILWFIIGVPLLCGLIFGTIYLLGLSNSDDAVFNGFILFSWGFAFLFLQMISKPEVGETFEYYATTGTEHYRTYSVNETKKLQKEQLIN